MISVFSIIFTKKPQGISSNLFVLGRKVSNFVPRASNTFRSFPTFPALDFSQLSDALRKRLHISVSYQCAIRFKKTAEWVVRLILSLGIISSIFRSSNTSFLSWMWLLYLKHCRLEALKTTLPPFAKNEKYANWFGSFDFHIYLKWDNMRHYEKIFKVQKVEWNVYNA